MAEYVIAAFILGIGGGVHLHRLIMAMVLDRSPDNICAYCEWMGRKKSRRKKSDGEQ